MTVADGELRLKKNDSAKVNFDDGVFFHIDEGDQQRPRHLQFSCKQDAEGEGCDVRLAKIVTPDADLIRWPGSSAST